MASDNDKKDTVADDPQPTAQEDSATAAVSSWLSGWYDTAKQKIAETNEFMRHDIQEFTQAVQSDASKLVAATATTMKEKLNINVDLEEASAATRVVKDSLSSFLGTIASTVGPIRPDDGDDNDETAYIGTASGTKVLSPAEARLFAIQTDPATFCNEPDNEIEFNAWLPDFDLEKRKNEISSLMLDCTQIRSLYTKLVPTAVSHRDFWARYFFRIHQHEKAEERRAMLVERAHKTHDDIEWEDDEDEWVQTGDTLPAEIKKEESSPHDNAIPRNSVQTADIVDTKLPTDSKIVPESSKPPAENTDKTVTANEYTAELIAHPEKCTEIIKSETTDTEPSASCETETKTDADHAEKDETEKINSNNVQPVSESKESTKTNEMKLDDDASKKSDHPTEAPAKETAMKTPSSGESSDDWEKDFDLDMTEEEIQQALEDSDKIAIDDIAEDWEDWE